MGGRPVIVAGFGFRSAVSAESLADAFAQVEQGAKIDAVATLAAKASSQAFRDFARTLGVPIRAIEQSSLEGQTTPTDSQASIAAYGVGSVAEAVALAAAGQNAKLISFRAVSTDGMATCALAKGNVR